MQKEIVLTEQKKVAQTHDKNKREGLTELRKRSTNIMLTDPKKGSTAQGNQQSEDFKCTLRVKSLHNLKCNNQLMMLVEGGILWQRSFATELNRSSIIHSDNSIDV